jgi:hypothetical protein
MTYWVAPSDLRLAIVAAASHDRAHINPKLSS